MNSHQHIDCEHDAVDCMNVIKDFSKVLDNIYLYFSHTVDEYLYQSSPGRSESSTVWWQPVH
jgi:hypothetical protein